MQINIQKSMDHRESMLLVYYLNANLFCLQILGACRFERTYVPLFQSKSGVSAFERTYDPLFGLKAIILGDFLANSGLSVRKISKSAVFHENNGPDVRQKI
ncbi:hypothetical protein [Neobacillus sp. LXY-4]|uniref:hypothetical protein n=1 Tax=Neobacillus sp. LXY-4 TaxID=3379826 RepID=UPI003EDF6E1B